MSYVRVRDWLSSLASRLRDSRDSSGDLVRRWPHNLDSLPGRVWHHARTPALALAWVAAAVVLRNLLGAARASDALLFYPLAVAAAAWRGGWSAAATATCVAVAALWLGGESNARTTTLLAGESLVLTGMIVSLTGQLRERVATLDAANRRLGELQIADARARTLDIAVRSLELQTPEYAIVLLDRQGLITDWRESAARTYGLSSDVVRGTPAASLFPDGATDVTFRALADDARRAHVVRRVARQRRGDGSTFEADVELAMTAGVGGDGFALVVRDRTMEHVRRASAAAAADAQSALRAEADVARRQLAALQSVTDPSMHAWAPSDLVVELLERGRLAIEADGIALVAMRGATPGVILTPDGLHPDGLADRAHVERARVQFDQQSTSRIVLVQNDPPRVTEQSLLRWPAGVASLVSVPVVYAGTVEGAIEVVDRNGRRSTEWEIALLQVVAARVAGLARDRGYAGSAVESAASAASAASVGRAGSAGSAVA